MEFPELPHLAVLLRDELLAHRGYLDVQVVFWQVEVGTEETRRSAVLVELDGEFPGFVVPGDLVEIKESRELSFALVCEIDLLCRRGPVENSVSQLA
jgi:hypothetical protein